MRATFLLAAALCIGGSAATAQRIIIVDSQGRPGTEFLDLQPAIDEASPGDILLVRDGSYSAATMDKGIQIHALPGAVLNSPAWSTGKTPQSFFDLRIENIPAHERAVVKGLTVSTTGGAVALGVEVVNCAGLVHLEGLTVTGPWCCYTPFDATALLIQGSSRVVVAHSTIWGLLGVRIEGSSVFAHDCTFIGNGVTPLFFWIRLGASPGVTLESGSVILSRCEARSGSSETPGIWCAGDLHVTGDANTLIAAGSGSGSSSAPAIDGTGTLRLDPIVQLVPAPGAPPIGPGLTVTTETFPSLSVTGAPLGGTLQGDLRADPGAPFGVLVGVPAPPLATPFGALWLDPLSSLAVLAGVLDPSGVAQWSVGVPAVATLRGAILTWQAVALTANGLRLSNPGQHLIDG